MKTRVNLLWSGGWDGTFRFLQLMQYPDVEIHPYYINDPNRHSAEWEKKAIAKIIEAAKQRFPATVCDVTFYDRDWIKKECADPEISEAFTYLRQKYVVGVQYEWFALLAKHLGVQFESGVVHQYHGKVEEAIDHEGKLIPVENDVLPDRWCVGGKPGNKAQVVFQNLILPIIKLSKKDEENIARENGWMDIMLLSWFCHSPIGGKPCGLCGPCDDAMNTGMEWRMPKVSQLRYKCFYKAYNGTKKLAKKVMGKK